jgi:hypothetical protein
VNRRPAKDDNFRMVLKSHDASNKPVLARLEALARDARKHGFDVLAVEAGGQPISLQVPRVQGPFQIEEPAKRYRD